MASDCSKVTSVDQRRSLAPRRRLGYGTPIRASWLTIRGLPQPSIAALSTPGSWTTSCFGKLRWPA